MRIEELFPLLEAEVFTRDREAPRVIRISTRFRKEWNEFSAAFKDFEENFESFLRLKALKDPPPLFGKKDGPLGTDVKTLKGVMHAHIIFGKALVIYRTSGDYLTLYRVTDHLAVETGRLTDLGSQVRTIDRNSPNDDDWEPIPVPPKPLSDPQKEAVQRLFMTMTEHPVDYGVLASFAAGKSDEMLTFLELEPTLVSVDTDALRRAAQDFLRDQRSRRSR